jgi:hypothetical protein
MKLAIERRVHVLLRAVPAVVRVASLDEQQLPPGLLGPVRLISVAGPQPAK